METILKWAGVVAVVIAIISLSVASTKSAQPAQSDTQFGSSVNGGNVTDFTAVNVTAGYWVGTTQIVSSAGNWLAGIVASAATTFDSSVLFSYTNSTSTTGTTQTLAAADITGYSTVILTPNTNSVTLTLPASSTLSAFVPAAGDWAMQCWINATTTAAKNITFAAGTGIDLEVSSSSLVIAPGNSGCFRFLRKPATATAFDIIAQFTTFVDGD